MKKEGLYQLKLGSYEVLCILQSICLLALLWVLHIA